MVSIALQAVKVTSGFNHTSGKCGCMNPHCQSDLHGIGVHNRNKINI